jgi:chromosome partitioning protein
MLAATTRRRGAGGVALYQHGVPATGDTQQSWYGMDHFHRGLRAPAAGHRDREGIAAYRMQFDGGLAPARTGKRECCVNQRKDAAVVSRESLFCYSAKYLLMVNTRPSGNRNRIVVLNPKGGCGKSTLAANIAACYAQRGGVPAIMDYDPQGSTTAWLQRRPEGLPPIHGIVAFRNSMQATRSWQLRVPNEVRTLVVDSPAAISRDDLRELTRDSSSILVPVLPSAMDIHAASRCIADLLLVAKINRAERKLAVVANRTRKNTKSFARLMRFLDSLGIPIIAVLRDSQNYVYSAEHGIGVHEMPPSKVRDDLVQVDRIVDWLDGWEERRRQAVEGAGLRLPPSFGLSLLRKPQFGSA